MHPLAHQLGARLRSFARSRRVWGTAAVLLLAAVLVIVPHEVKAFSIEQYLAGALAWVLGLIVTFLGKIISILIYVLMGFLQYNGFADAPPVVMGWVIIRDLVNMVFIVALILSAVATILNYETSDLHVKNVLPKLIGAAVLINFSKMIVGLLVDASQVVMLTFVNAFQASGVGNFSQLLGLPSFTSVTGGDTLATANSARGEDAPTGQILIDVLLAYMLAMAMLVISIGVILIMILFTIARIVGIWVLLIVSPAAFLATSLPKKLQKIFGSLAHEFWDKLTAFLVGGPTMAFFLWLAFATVRSSQQLGQDGGVATRLGLFNRQASPITQNGVYSANSVFVGGAEAGANIFLSRVGSADGIASFIVGLALMLIGIDQAAKAASAASSTLGSYAGSIAGTSKQLARWLGTRPIATPWNAADRRFKITDRTASTLALVPGLNTLSGGKLAQFANYRKKEMEEMAKQDVGLYNSLTGWRKKVKGASMKTWSRVSPVLGTEADVKAYASVLKSEIADGHYKENIKESADKYEKELAKQNPSLSKDEIKNMAKSRAQSEENKHRSEQFLQALKTFEKAHDTEAVLKLQEDADKNPLLWQSDPQEFEDAVRRMSDDDIDKMSPELASSGKFWAQFLKNKKAITVDANGNITGAKASVFSDLASKYSKHAGKIKGLQGYIDGSLGGGVTPSYGSLQTAGIQDFKGGKGGNARIYDGATGSRIMSAGEAATRNALGSSFGSASHGRDPGRPGRLDGSSASQMHDAVGKYDLAINELQDISNDSDLIGVMAADKAVSREVVERARDQMDSMFHSISARGAGIEDATRAEIDAGLNYFSKMSNQFGNLDGESKAIMIQSVASLADSAEFMAANYKKMSGEDKQGIINFAKAVREQADRNTANRRKGIAISAADASADKMLADLQAAFPKDAVIENYLDSAGMQQQRVKRAAAVEPIAKSLHI